MSSNTKNQHYIPRMYLKRFGNKKGKNYRIDVYDKKQDKFFLNQSVESVAYSNYYYDTPIETFKPFIEECKFLMPNYDIKKEIENDAHYVETYLSRVESEANTLLDELNEDFNILKNENKELLLHLFIYLQAYRSSGFRDGLNDMLMQEKEIALQYYRVYGASEERIKEIEEDYNSRAKKNQIEMMLSTAEYANFSFMLLQKYDYYEVEIAADVNFILGDNMFFILTLEFPEVVIPINKKKAIAFKKKGTEYGIIKKDSNNKITLNYAQALYCNYMTFLLSDKLYGIKDEFLKIKGFEILKDSIN